MRTTGKKVTPVFHQLLPRVDQKSPLFHEKPKQEKVRVQDINVFFLPLGRVHIQGFDKSQKASWCIN
jgi:hypothetical protein